MLRLSMVFLSLCACPGTDSTPKETGSPETGAPDTQVEMIDGDGDGFSQEEDCNDADPAIHPEAREACDDLDNDCDGLVDDEDPDVQGTTTWFMDADQDGYGTSQFSQEACLQPSGYAENANDCNDLSASVYPDADEVCDGADNDCDGLVDEEDATDVYTWYFDGDGDGYGVDSDTETACDAPRDYVSHGGDCDDGDPAYHPGALEADCTAASDYNCDGSVGFDDADGDGFAACEDCDDAVATTHTGAVEVCDGVDNDCDGDIDSQDGNVQGTTTFYADADGDGYGGSQFQADACEAPAGYVSSSDDCDDLDPASHPGASETCDGADNDCDGDIDEGLGTPWYQDSDSDGYGNGSVSAVSCDAPSGYVANALDCDDFSASTSPSAYEVCDGVDNDCDGSTDEDAINATTWYLDTDGDGYGSLSGTIAACDSPSGYAGNASDCDDAAASVSPAATESCDGIDNDCDGTTDEADAVDATTWYADADTDGYGSPTSAVSACSQPTGTVTDATDCDDTAFAVNPAATEFCDSVDNDCDGDTDEADAADATTWYIDSDSDGYGDASSTTLACDAPSGAVRDATDCDDTDGNRYLCTSCQDILDQGFSTGDGAYIIDVDGTSGTTAPFSVYCDMTSHEGGWTLVLRAGYGRDLTTPDLTGDFTPYPTAATDPGNNVLEKMSDALINQIKSASGSDIAYWVTTPGAGTGLLGAENFHRGDCIFALHQTSDQVKSSSCHYSTVTYSTSPTWESGGHWWDNNSSYRWAFGYANEGDHNTGQVCHQDGTGLGPHTPSHAPFHRGWCSTGDWGVLFVR